MKTGLSPCNKKTLMYFNSFHISIKVLKSLLRTTIPGFNSGNEKAGQPSLGQHDIEKTRSSGPSRA